MIRKPRRGSLSVALIVLLVSTTPVVAAGRDADPPAFRLAQAGSTGGAIGKQGKSAGGGEEHRARPARTTRSKPQRATAARAAPAARATSGCSRIAGSWSWFTRRVVVIRPDGTATAGALSATWTCTGNRATLVWSHGYTDRLTLSPDGSRLEGTNGFLRVWGNRI